MAEGQLLDYALNAGGAVPYVGIAVFVIYKVCQLYKCSFKIRNGLEISMSRVRNTSEKRSEVDRASADNITPQQATKEQPPIDSKDDTIKFQYPQSIPSDTEDNWMPVTSPTTEEATIPCTGSASEPVSSSQMTQSCRRKWMDLASKLQTLSLSTCAHEP